MDSSNSKEQETSLAEPLLPLVPATDHHEVVVLVAPEEEETAVNRVGECEKEEDK